MRNLTKICSFFIVFSLLSGTFFVPGTANAGLISSIFGTEASASDEISTDNSQNMPLLQANVSSAPILKDKKATKTSKDTKNTEIAFNDLDNDTNVIILSENALVPSASPVSSIEGVPDIDSSDEQVSVYVVRKGDTIGQIAEMFDVSVNTILLANDLKKGQKLSTGDVLFILPISGREHSVVKGQTLKSIAKLYKTDAEDIALYNGLAMDSKLSVGDKLMIPGGDLMVDEGGDKPAPNLNTSVAKDQNYYKLNPIQNLIGYFLNPVPTGRKTQGLHGPGHRGIDIGAPTGTPIYASADGKVLAVKTGCKVGQVRCGGGYGNMAIVEHPNGTRTLYAHMSKLATKSGAIVSQAEIIGYVGNTGRSTGPHIHFEVFNAKNPGSDWSWATNQVANN
ncbi:MAG: M23 family metallopeptidase [Chitinophagaceae bacterium]